MLKKEDKDGIIEYLKSTLTRVERELHNITLDPDNYLADESTIQQAKDMIQHALANVTW